MKRTKDMTSFEKAGEAQLLAYEGQRQVAAAMGRLLSKAFLSLIHLISRSGPSPFVP
jgi:hypothetical protein